jgi:hypothetical protein
MVFLRGLFHRARRTRAPATRLLAAVALTAIALSAAGFGCAAPAPEANPAAAPPMRFVRVKSDGAACRPDCPEWISAEGKIVAGSADALARVIAKLGDRRLPILINSPGGSVRDAMAMGRLIRAKRLAVAIAHTEIAPCPASARQCPERFGAAQAWGAYCASACVLALAGGVERYVSPLAFVGVHQLTEVVRKTRVQRAYAVRYLEFAGLKIELSRTLVRERRSTTTTRRAADKGVDDSVEGYLEAMGVRDPVMKLTLATSSRDVRWLTAEELAASRLATIWVDDASPIADDAGANGLRGQPIDAASGAAAVFVAKRSAPVASPIDGRPTELALSFAYRRGGGAALATVTAEGAAASPPARVVLTLYPEGATFRAAAAAGEPARVGIPLRSLCRLKRDGRVVVGFGEPGPRPVVDDGSTARRGEASAAFDLATAGAKPLFDEACPRDALARR